MGYLTIPKSLLKKNLKLDIQHLSTNADGIK